MAVHLLQPPVFAFCAGGNAANLPRTVGSRPLRLSASRLSRSTAAPCRSIETAVSQSARSRSWSLPVASEAEAFPETSGDSGAEEAAPKPTKLYVGNLPWNVDSESLAEILQEAGSVLSVEVILDRDTGRSRGYAFVHMSSPEDAQAAIERFDGSELGGRVLKVNFPSPPGARRVQTTPRTFQGGAEGRRGPRGGDSPNKVFVGNLSWGVDDLALSELFSEFGKVLEARVVMDRETGRSRGFGFVTLSSDGEVKEAVSNLDGAEVDGRQIRVNPATQKPDRV